MVEQLRITVLAENTAARRDVLAERGLALWIQADGRNILFDTGQGLVLAHNAEVLNVDLTKAHDVVLSHGHYDHTGGLAAMPNAFGQASLYVHPDAFQARFNIEDRSQPRSVGWTSADCQDVRQRVANVVLTRVPTRIAEGVWVTGAIPRRTSFEDTGGCFYLDEAGTLPDPLSDDQAMYIETAKGLVVLLGCAHAGLVNTLDYISELTGQRELHAVLGGMHLLHASEDRIARSVSALQSRGVRVIGPGHCTGPRATAGMWSAFPHQIFLLPVGSSPFDPLCHSVT